MKKFLIALMVAMLGGVSSQAVTFKVKVPDGTLKCYVCGDFNGWDVTNCPQMEAAGDNLFTLDRPDLTDSDVAKGYKYVCGQDWKYVEKDENGGEISNRTSIGDPDVVGSWANDNQWDIKEISLTVNNLPRLITVYTPKGYDESTDTYPVIYYNTVQQRYSNAGDDNDNGDNFFGSLSWKAQSTMENLREETGKAYVMVQICSMLGENTVSENPEYKGTGEADQYLNAFVTELMPYIQQNFRVKNGKENTTIVGADFGALFSLYAAVTRPDVFGCSVVMSPMLWINNGDYETLASKASSGQTYYVSAGSREPEWLITPTEALAETLGSVEGVNVYYTLYNNAAHNDDDWGTCFPYILKGMAANSAPPVSGGNDTPADDFSNNVYILYAGDNSANMQKIGEMVYTEQYKKQGDNELTKAFVLTYPISAEYKGTFYWNVEKGEEGSGEWLNDSPKTIGFNNNRNKIAWHNVAVFEDETSHNIAAHSEGFRVINDGKTTYLTQVNDYVSEGTVNFGADKTFVIKFGSVNSNSEQSALTPTLTVSDNCSEAVITYDFNLNTVTVEETVNGGTAPEPEKPDFKTGEYTLYGGENSDNLQEIGKMTFTDDFRMIGSDTPLEAFVYTNDIPVEYNSYYYWNIAIGDKGDNNWVLSSPKNISFSTKKNATSWHTVALFENGTTSDIAAHSEGFRVVANNQTTMMTNADNHQAKLTVQFPGADKTFQINYGSVNSSSDMGPMTPKLSVSENCLEAEITYDFSLNKVYIVETKTGEATEELKIAEFSAVPSVAPAGSDVKVKLSFNKAVETGISCKDLAGNVIPVTLVREGNSAYSAKLPAMKEGLYTLTLTVTDGDIVTNDFAPLNIRILPEKEYSEKELTVNAYEDINWENIGRYKANFHTHTSQSFDTQYTTTEVVDKYQKAGYQILALTDHDANSYPWNMFSLYNPNAQDRDGEAMGMLPIPGNELSKDRRNSWSESTGGEFNHHNDFFTGRKGQEFMSLRESYAYSQAIGGLQIINHPGQYWNLSTEYKNGEKNSPEWHAENFRLFESLVGLEVYNQGNRRPNDRILWDQVLTITMPERPVWGYSCDDTHTAEQYFRNYQFMLMPQLSVEDLKEAMMGGNTVFSYEYTGSGEAKAPHVESITVDKEAKTITIDTDDADTIEWIYSTYRTGSAASTTKSAVVGYGKTFDYNGFGGSYVRARLINSFGETATQPFGFECEETTSVSKIEDKKANGLTVINNPGSDEVTLICTELMIRVSVMNAGGTIVRFMEFDGQTQVTFSKAELSNGVYVIVAATENSAYTGKILR